MKKNKSAFLSVDRKFFDNIFEKERKRLGTEIGKPLSQREFTELLYKTNVKFKYPKPFPKDKINATFPKRKGRKRGTMSWML